MQNSANKPKSKEVTEKHKVSLNKDSLAAKPKVLRKIIKFVEKMALHELCLQMVKL
jgi:hypothetical protein